MNEPLEESAPQGGTTRMFQISESDLADLEALIPRIMQDFSEMCNRPAVRVKLRRLKEILSNVRWDYGPYSHVEKIPVDDD